MAMALIVIGFVIMTVFPALTTLRAANQQALTQSNLRSLMLATAAYVQANGCLPCPANPAWSGTNFGRLGYASTTTACGTCSSPEGLPPFVALGLPASTARDGWGHWITMRVDPALTASFGVTPPTAVCSSAYVSSGFCTAAQLAAPASNIGLCKTGLAPTNRITVATPAGGSQQAAVLFVSHGKTGYGSYFAQPRANANNGSRLPFSTAYPSCTTTSGFAQCNADGNAAFVDAPLVLNNTQPYDDLMTYADRNTLVSMFGSGACSTVW